MRPDNPGPMVVGTGKIVEFGYRAVQEPHQLLLRGPSPDMYTSSDGFRWHWLDPSGLISGSSILVVLLIIAFRCHTVSHKTQTMRHHCFFGIFCPPSFSKDGGTQFLPHPGNECQPSIIDFLSCILGNLNVYCLQIVITLVLVRFKGKEGRETLLAPA